MADYFYNAIRRDIVMIKNDTLSYGFQVQGLEGQIPSNIVFTCKDTPESNRVLFSVSLSDHITERAYDPETDTRTYAIRIPPEYTDNVEVGRYFYDLQLTVNLDIFTLMKGRLTVEYQITGGSVEPTPAYENGDNFKYPLIGIPEGTIKLYTEQWISDIGSAINDANGNNLTYNTREMSDAIRALGSYVPFTPTFNETEIASGSSVGTDILLPEHWDSDYILIKIILADSRDENRQMVYYTTPSHLINISNIEGYIRLYMRHPDVTLGYVNYSLNTILRTLTRRGTGNVLYIRSIIGLTGANCSIRAVDIDMALSLPVSSRSITTLSDLYDFDLILITLNNGNYTNCVPLASIISPYKSTNPFKEYIEYYLDDPANGASITIAAHSMSEANYLAVTGVKFIKN